MRLRTSAVALSALLTLTTTLAQSSSNVLPVRPVDPGAPAAVEFTYPGGSGAERLTAATVDAAGNTFITGYTDSRDLPATSGAFQREPRSGADAFVAKLDASGRTTWSTCIGGNNARASRFSVADSADAVAVDPQGNVYIAGSTTSTDFPVANAYQPGAQASAPFPGANAADGFITKFNPTGSALVYSTYLGGADGSSRVVAIAVGPAGDAWAAVHTDARQFRTTVDLSNGQGRMVVMKFSTSGAVLWATRLGGGNETLNDLAVDDQGQAMITGFRPVTCLDPVSTLSCAEAFVTKLDTGGGAVIYSTGIRGARITPPQGLGISIGTSVAALPGGSAVVTGTSNWIDLVLQNPWQTTNDGTFTARLSPVGPIEMVSHGGGGRLATDLSGGVHLARGAVTDGLPLARAFVARHPDLPLFISTNRGETWGGSSPEIEGGALSLAIAPNQNFVYLGTTTGLFRSVDRGNTWSRLDTLRSVLPASVFVEHVAVDPHDESVLYVGVTSLLRSADGGRTWTILRTSTPGVGGYSVRSLAVSPHDRSVWVGTNNGVEVSTDGGRTWTARNAGLPTAGARVESPAAIVFDPVRPGVVLGAFNGGVYGWFDDGEGWEELTRYITHPDTDIPERPIVAALAVDPTTGRRIYAGTFNRGVLKTEDGGVTWTRTLENTSIVALAADPHASQIVYASVREFNRPGVRIYRSLDRGETWTPFDSGLTLRELPHRLYADPEAQGRLYALSRLQREVPYVTRLARSGATYVPTFASYLLDGAARDVAATPAGETILALQGLTDDRITIVRVVR